MHDGSWNNGNGKSSDRNSYGDGTRTLVQMSKRQVIHYTTADTTTNNYNNNNVLDLSRVHWLNPTSLGPRGAATELAASRRGKVCQH